MLDPYLLAAIVQVIVAVLLMAMTVHLHKLANRIGHQTKHHKKGGGKSQDSGHDPL